MKKPVGKSTNQEDADFLDQTIDTDVPKSAVDPELTQPGRDTDAPRSETVRFSEAIGDWIGPYQLIEKIGSGGMGTVYMAQQREPVVRKVALKIIKAGMDTSQVIARFEAERQALSMMEHPNIARVLDAGATERGRPYFVMELVRGLPVTRYCDEFKLGIDERLRLFGKVCDAVQHAHQKGIIHRDLKPSNILVGNQDGRPAVKVIDFGVAKATNQRLTEKTMSTQQGQVVGTLEYMSPEQAQMTDANVDTRSDIYSLGVVLYELMTGSTPLNRQSIAGVGYLDILNKIKDEEPTRPSSRLTETEATLQKVADERGTEPRKLASQLKGDLDWIVLKALEKDPARRFESAAGFADDIARYLNAEPITARPPTSLYLIGKFTKRHKVAVSAGVIVLATLISGIVISTDQSFRARSEQARANQLAAKVEQQLEELKKQQALERENTQLSQQVQKQTEQVRAELASEFEIFCNHGQWTKALNVYREYQSRFGEVPMDMAVLRLNCLDALSKTQQLKQEIVRLEKLNPSPNHLAKLKLWRGYAFLADGQQQTDAPSLIRQAIATDRLSPADQAFAKGLVEPELDKSLQNFQSALQHSPFHAQARMQYVVTLVLLGRYEQALQQLEVGHSMFPNDSRFELVKAASHAFSNQADLFNQSIKDLKQNYVGSELANLQTLGRVSRAVNKQFREYDREGLLDWFSIMREGYPLFQESNYRQIPFPAFQKERIAAAYGEFGRSFLDPLMQIARESKKHDRIIRNCQNAWQLHEDGMFKCFEAWSWYAKGQYAKSAEVFSKAVSSDGLFPEIRNQAIYGGFLSRKRLYDQTGNSADLKASMQLLAEYLQTDFESHRVPLMFQATADAGRWDLAQRITDQMIEREGGMAFNWTMNLIMKAEEKGNLGLALSVCENLMNDSPGVRLLDEIHSRLIAKISSQQ